MRISTLKSSLLYCFIISLATQISSAQLQNTNTTQDPKFEQLLSEKRKINSSIIVNERYKIQVFSGSSEGARKALSNCKQEFPALDGTIIFNTPNYKVWIGNFRTRIEAEHYIVDLRKKYPNLLLIKPQK